MKKTRYTEEQIAFALRQAETGTPVGEVIRKMGISTQTFYRWKKQYGQMGVDCVSPCVSRVADQPHLEGSQKRATGRFPVCPMFVV
jgi:transposase-like protein